MKVNSCMSYFLTTDNNFSSFDKSLRNTESCFENFIEVQAATAIGTYLPAREQEKTFKTLLSTIYLGALTVNDNLGLWSQCSGR